MKKINRTRKVLDHGELQLIDCMPATPGAGDQRVVDSARVSILGQDVRPVNTNGRLINYLVKHEHWSPLESVKLTFRIKTPIFIARQWMRHRTWAFNEQSARYGVVKDDYYLPSQERLESGGQNKDNKQGSGAPLDPQTANVCKILMDVQCAEAYEVYEALLDNGVARELARAVLPQNMYTEFYGTVDLRNLLGFCKLRIHPHAQLEIREYAKLMLETAKEIAPLTVEAFQKHWVVS